MISLARESNVPDGSGARIQQLLLSVKDTAAVVAAVNAAVVMAGKWCHLQPPPTPTHNVLHDHVK